MGIYRLMRKARKNHSLEMTVMNENWAFVEESLKQFPEYQAAVFEQGFLVTNQALSFGTAFPYFGNWQETSRNGVYFYLRDNQKLFLHEAEGRLYFLIGHAYDPFAEIAEEEALLARYAQVSGGDWEAGLPCIDDLTGLFVMGYYASGRLRFWGDFESMRAVYYGVIDGRWYLASHEELVALRETLTPDPYVARLERYRWYPLYGEGLPGDISHYLELKKLICNNYVSYENGVFTVGRLYPRAPIHICAGEEEYRQVVAEIARIMQKSLALTAQKWPRVAVSVTGGRDSKGSLAASLPVKDKLQYFSYNSQPAEQVDCDAAHRICEAVGVPHTVYEIPLDKAVYPEYDLVRAILCVNSNRKYFNHNDIMKRIYFRREKPFDVEVKSWTSEIGRAFCYVRYGVRHLPKKATGRRVNAINNIFLLNPKLMYETDRKYREYLEKTEYNEHMFNYDWTDLIILEMRDSRWGADVISCEHMFSYDVTVPYNNRHLSDLLQMPPFEKRLASQTHIDFTNLLCPEIEKTNIAIRDAAHTKKRAVGEKLYYFISCVRPI